MALKAFLALIAVVAIGVGLVLPTGRGTQAHATSQIPTVPLGPA